MTHTFTDRAVIPVHDLIVYVVTHGEDDEWEVEDGGFRPIAAILDNLDGFENEHGMSADPDHVWFYGFDRGSSSFGGYYINATNCHLSREQALAWVARMNRSRLVEHAAR